TGNSGIIVRNSGIIVTTRSPSFPVTVPQIIPNTTIEANRYELTEQPRQARVSYSKEHQIE
ncbi:12667_t:CDS:1, partial [Gigaspora rosea]